MLEHVGFVRVRRFSAALGLCLAAMLPGCAASEESNAHLGPDVSIAEHGWSAEVMRIIDEGKNNNQVMEHLTYLTQEIGPRLTGSTRAKVANEWQAELFRSWGLQNVEVREWGTIPVGFDRGPSYGRMIGAQGGDREFEFSWPAWSPGTNGPVRGTVYREPSNQEEFDAIAENLKGAWILQPAKARGSRRGVVETSGATPTDWLAKCKEAGIAGVISAARGGEIVHTSGRFRDVDLENLPTWTNISVRRSDYDAMNSRIADGEEVVVEFDCQATFIPGPVPCYNVIAEIPGTEKPDEVVIISAHTDSWDGPGSQGTVDNGTGTCVTLEAARILAASGVRPKRTIRFILWTGEEQGLLGSRAYVDTLSEEELSKISAVFVDDGGTNYEGGLQVVEPMAPMLIEATAPVNDAFPDMPVEVHINPRMPRGGASDHASFNAKGVPGFFWDEVGRANYRYAWHTQNDKLDQAIPEYLVQSSTCAAITAFNVANAETLLPREVRGTEEEEQTEEGPRRRRPAEEGNSNSGGSN
ncbi:MAG: M20/M25/M40 family metallo-hydrolase [Phycisphaerales bacterium]|nr:M20/M25/M40 family metallo-hydrolase [Phycisphaerales bacterium]